MRFFVLVLAIIFLLGGCDSVSYVDRLEVVNPTEYDLLVEVRSADSESWLPLGTVSRNSEAVKENVIDMGETWVFRVRYLGDELGEDTVSRSDLETAGWRYEIPVQVGEQLAQQGHAPSID